MKVSLVRMCSTPERARYGWSWRGEGQFGEQQSIGSGEALDWPSSLELQVGGVGGVREWMAKSAGWAQRGVGEGEGGCARRCG